MDPPPTSFSGRRRSSIVDPNPAASITSASPAPRKASTWDSPTESSLAPTASDISSKRSSETPEASSASALGYPNADNITTRKASAWDDEDTAPMSSTRASVSDIVVRRTTALDRPPWDVFVGAPPGQDGSTWGWMSEIITMSPEASFASALGYPNADNITTRKASAWDDEGTAPMSSTRASVSDIAVRRATALDRPPWDVFAGAPPGQDGSTWGWMSEIITMTSGITSDRNRVFYDGNMNYIFENYNDKSLAITDVEAIMYAYGVEKISAEDMLNKIDPQKRGTFNMNYQNKQILVASTINFSTPNEPLINLRHASKCLQQNLLSPIHFAGYIIDVLKGRYLGNEPRFMILGMYSIFGVLEGSTSRKLTTKDVETFTRLWTVTNADEVQDLIDMIKDDNNGTTSCWELYNLLYRRNVFGKQRIQMFDTSGKQNPSLFFTLMDKDEDGFLSSADLHSFAAIFGRYPSDEAIDRVTRKLDLDGDGKISLEDFHGAMAPNFDGMTWEFWLVAILLTLQL